MKLPYVLSCTLPCTKTGFEIAGRYLRRLKKSVPSVVRHAVIRLCRRLAKSGWQINDGDAVR